MKLVCEKNELQKSINIVTKAVAPKSPVYVLEGVYIKAEEKKDNYVWQRRHAFDKVFYGGDRA